MNRRRVSTPVLLSFLIVMFLMVIGCGEKDATSIISGTVTGDVQDGVTIRLTGDATTSMTTDTSGNFSFTNWENGTYTITPYLDGYTFDPTSTEVVVSGASVSGVDFVATFTGYNITGTVTGVVQEGVTLTAILGTATTDPATTTTASGGSYTLSGITPDGSYTVTPSLAGYKFTPSSLNVTVSGASQTVESFESALAHAAGTATGTYTWDSTTNVLTITWTSINYPCGGPSLNTETKTEVTITDITMTWPYDHMTWARASGIANIPAGTWTAIDRLGNSNTAVFTASSTTTGSVSWTGVIITCASAWLEHSTDDYKVWLSYQETTNIVKSVNVTGTGTSTALSLPYNNTTKIWESDSAIDLGATEPSLSDNYTFTIADSGTTWVETAAISCSVENFATNLTPTGTASSATPTFSWTEISDAGAVYVVQVLDGSTLKWESAKTTGTSVIYSGSSLTSGHTYNYKVVVNGTSLCPSGQSLSDSVTFTIP